MMSSGVSKGQTKMNFGSLLKERPLGKTAVQSQPYVALSGVATGQGREGGKEKTA